MLLFFRGIVPSIGGINETLDRAVVGAGWRSSSGTESDTHDSFGHGTHGSPVVEPDTEPETGLC
jgi:hypothetical protein